MGMATLLKQSRPVMPVLTVHDAEHALPLAQALKNGGLTVVEVTLRTPAALDVIRAMKKVEGLVVGAGTVTEPAQFAQVQQAGADFAVSPGATPALLKAGMDSGIPFLPAVCTPSELMQGLSHGYRQFKLFPAAQAGGIGMLKALSGPFSDVRFCPTGGITIDNSPDYLMLPNVDCVGGSWIVPQKELKARDWARIEELARTAANVLD